MRYAGEVYVLPPDEAEDGDEKYRRHVLLNDCGDGDDAICTFAYASTQYTEALYGAANHLVNPVQGAYQKTGFVRPTYVYPSRLIVCEGDHVTEGGRTGRLIDDFVQVREQLRYALGIGTGTGEGSGPAYGSYRGMIAVPTPAVRESCGWDWGVVVTEGLYSKQRRFQTVVPLVDAQWQELQGVVAIDKPWLTNLGLHDALAFVPLVASFFESGELAEILPLTIDEGTMEEIDFALKLRFAL
jgi:hypothetical protein